MDFHSGKKTIIGIGSPVVDRLAHVADSFINEKIDGKKGGMELISDGDISSILQSLGKETYRAPGGSAGNTLFTLAKLGMSAGFLGKMGDDENGTFYKEMFKQAGGDVTGFKIHTSAPSALSLCLITPDAERTMRTHLGAAMALSPDDITAEDFKGYTHLHTEGYLLFNRELITHILECAREAGCTVSMDLASFEVVENSKDILPDLLKNYVDIVFANEDEAQAFTGTSDPETALDRLGKYCHVCALKMGEKGAFLKHKNRTVKVEAVPVLEVVDVMGASIPEERWEIIKNQLTAI
jgi:sugar/nucleoside kinase (ribokinase family)